jgi:hypothetical protein
MVVLAAEGPHARNPSFPQPSWREDPIIVAGRYLDGKLECSHCGTITLNLAGDVTDETAINCSRCGHYLGTWGELQDAFHREAKNASAFDLNKGRFKRLRPKAPPDPRTPRKD